LNSDDGHPRTAGCLGKAAPCSLERREVPRRMRHDGTVLLGRVATGTDTWCHSSAGREAIRTSHPRNTSSSLLPIVKVLFILSLTVGSGGWSFVATVSTVVVTAALFSSVVITVPPPGFTGAHITYLSGVRHTQTYPQQCYNVMRNPKVS
jgi:hypothetical protein